eukprot:PhF_6_TR11024/c0_g1_i2/m.17859
MWDYWLHVIAPVGTCGVLSILCLKTSLFHAQQISNNNTLQLTVTSSHPLWMTASTAILSIATVMFRKTKKHYNHKRLRWLHAFLMTAGTVGSNLGAYSAFREIVGMKNGKHLNSFHAQVGVIALLLLNLQALMGWLTMFPQWKKHIGTIECHVHMGEIVMVLCGAAYACGWYGFFQSYPPVSSTQNILLSLLWVLPVGVVTGIYLKKYS